MQSRAPKEWSAQSYVMALSVLLLAVVGLSLSGCFKENAKPASNGQNQSEDQAQAEPAAQSQPEPQSRIASKPTAKPATQSVPVYLPHEENYRAPEQHIDWQLNSVREAVVSGDEQARAIEKRLTELGSYLSRQFTENAFSPCELVAADFSASGIDDDSTQPRFNDPPIEVTRWVASGAEPKYDSANAFKNFFDNALKGWSGANDFAADFKIYQLEQQGDIVTASLVVDMDGYLESSRRRRQTTSLWRTQWTKAGGELRLANVKILGREEVTTRVRSGRAFNCDRVFKDASPFVFQNVPAWKKQLRYGIDQWAQQIPGINLLGNQGLALRDIDGDGLCDIYVCEPHGLPNLLFLQNPNGTVREVAASSNVDILDESRCALFADFDNDGDQDLAISTDENLVLFSNKGRGKFQLEHKLRGGAGGTSLAAADYDADGDLDIFMCRDFPLGHQADILATPAKFGDQNILLRNDEGWLYTDVTEEVGLGRIAAAKSNSCAWLDFDSDGDQDLLIANEWTRSRLLENRDGQFIDASKKLNGLAASVHRSVSVADFNRDSKPDFFLASDSSTRALRVKNQLDGSEKIKENRGATSPSMVVYSREEAGANDHIFRKYALPSPVFSTETAFGSAVIDINNDGLEDILVANGFVSADGDDAEAFWAKKVATTPFTDESMAKHAAEVSDLLRQGMSLGGGQRNQAYLNLGALGFANFSSASGIDFPGDTRAIAAADWDNDGDIDVVTLSRNGPRVRIFLNQTNSAEQSVSLTLQSVASNADAIGAKVEVWLVGSDAPCVRWVQSQSGYLAQSSRELCIGLGEDAEIAKVVIIWPNGSKETFEGNIRVGHSYRIVEGTQLPFEPAQKHSVAAISEGSSQPYDTAFPVSDYSTFFPPSVLPPCSIKAVNSTWYRLQNTTGKPLLLLFVDDSERSNAILRSMSESSESPQLSGLSTSAIFCATGAGEIDDAIATAKKVTAKHNWSSLAATIPVHELAKIKIAFRDWFGIGTFPERPFGLLLNEAGFVETFYPTKSLSPSVVLKSINAATSRNLASDDNGASGIPQGFWVQETRYPDSQRLSNRFRNLGLDDIAQQLAEQTKQRRAQRLALAAIRHVESSNFPKARELLGKSVSAHPRCYLANLLRGHLARKEASRMPTNSSRHADVLNEAIGAYTVAMDLDKSGQEAVIGYTNACVDASRVDLAIKALTSHLQRRPESPRVHAVMGRLLFSAGKRGQALSHLESAFDARPTLPFVAGDLGFLHLSSGNSERAKRYLSIAHRYQPSDLDILRLYAESQFITLQFEQAAELFEKSVEMKPSGLRSTSILAWILATSPVESVRDAKRAVELIAPLQRLQGDESAYINEIAAACYAESGDFERALVLQKKAANQISTPGGTVSFYDEAKKRGMEERLGLYENNRPYRTSSLDEIPIQKISDRIAESKKVNR